MFLMSVREELFDDGGELGILMKRFCPILLNFLKLQCGTMNPRSIEGGNDTNQLCCGYVCCINCLTCLFDSSSKLVAFIETEPIQSSSQVGVVLRVVFITLSSDVQERI